MIVKVIVDLPAKQVNRPFDYSVPEELEDVVQLGMRVFVSFGKLQRQGFIVGIKSDSNYNGKLKPLSGVMDYESFLNTELLELSETLAHSLQAFRISILQTMLPSMLKTKYQAVFNVVEADKFVAQLPPNEWYQGQQEFDRYELESQLPMKLINRMRKEGIIELNYLLLDKTTQKTQTLIRTTKSLEELALIKDTLRANSHQQQRLLDYLLQHFSHKIIKKDFMHQCNLSHATLKAAVSKGWIYYEEEAIYRDPLKDMTAIKTDKRVLTDQQQVAYDRISQSLKNNEAQTFLLEGVTGSGKTEIYLQLMADALALGQTAILLVPEISLTPQMVERVVGRFGQGVAVLHSGLSATEKYDEWQRIIRNEAKIVVGARSSIFAPLDNIGVIIMDEEHETTYKQADNPRYHAREVALWRSQYHHAPLILGSATPSLESRSRAQVGRYELIHLSDRVNQRPLPPVEIVDMTKLPKLDNQQELSPQLLAKIQDRLEKKEQIVLLQNRRGYASYLLCRECGYILQCPHCDISLTYHKADNKMKCHYCGFTQTVPHSCPSCGSKHIRTHGIGTQKVAESLNELFPEAGITRMDNDTTQKKGEHQRLLDEFARHETDILLGTQMIAKGLDFENVTLVGVINADTALNLPDFRASERTFQLLTQVSGRTGRGRLVGEVVIQTYNPDHYVIQLAKKHDYETFFRIEMKRRHLMHYPPYYYTTLITVSSKNQGWASQLIYDLKARLGQELNEQGDLIMIGPNRNSVARIKDHFYFNLLLKYKKKDSVAVLLQDILNSTQDKIKQGVYVSIDNEPQYFS